MVNILEILGAFGAAGQIVGQFWWIVLPVAFYFIFKPLWLDHVIKNRLIGLKNVLIEIIPPKEIEKGPKMMESFFAGIAGVVVTIGPFEKYLKGDITNIFSLELVGAEGEVHYYIRMEEKYRNMVEAQIYAQYPDAEIREVEDYVKKFPKIIPNKDWDLWGTDIMFVMPDPYPIKTYDKFEESVTGEMIDPMAAIVEVLGRLTPGQHIWLQFVTQPLTERWREDEVALIGKLAGKEKKKSKGILGHIGDIISDVLTAIFKPPEAKKSEKKVEQPLEFRLTPGEKEVLKAVEENLGKNAFLTKMRLIYLGRKEGYDKSFISTFFGTLKQFSDLNLNSFKPYDGSKTYAYYLFKKNRMAYRQRKIYRRYKDRDMSGKKIVFSTKEMATVFHFPDMGVMAPTLPRVESKKGSAPVNLPIG